EPGHVALHVGHEHRYADPREPFGDRRQGDRLAGARGAGDQAVAVAELRLQEDLALAGRERLRRGDGLADENGVHHIAWAGDRSILGKPRSPVIPGVARNQRGVSSGIRRRVRNDRDRSSFRSAPARVRGCRGSGRDATLRVASSPKIPHPMHVLVVTLARWAALAVVVSFSLLPFDAAALSRRDTAAVEALDQRMAAAEQRYREALVGIGNAEPGAIGESNAAIEDMEDVVADCQKQKGCHVGEQIAAFKRLLKLNADAEAGMDEDWDDGDPMDPDPDHAGDARLAADVPEAARAAALLEDSGHRFDDMVQYNPAVQAAIRRWLTDMRPSLIDSYENYEYLRQTMWPSFERAGLPEALLFGIMAKESNGKAHATSRAGAAGPMQFMYATGKRFGLGEDGTGFDTRYDPHASAEAAAAYLNERLGQLNDSIEMSLAAYNGGEGRALRIHRENGGRGFWNAGAYDQLPAETRDHVPMVIAAAWLFLHPRQDGLHFPRVQTRPALLELEKPASIYELTICLGNGRTRNGFMRALRNLNPRYRADS